MASLTTAAWAEIVQANYEFHFAIYEAARSRHLVAIIDSLWIAGLENASRFPALFAELLRRGYTQRDLALIARGNILRALRRAEAVAARLQAEGVPITMSASP